MNFILLTMGIGFLVAIDSILNPSGRVLGASNAWLCVSFVLFGGWLCLCTALVPGRGNARYATNGCWQWIAEGILILSVVRLCSRRNIASTLIALMLSCTSGTVAYACYQTFVSMPAFRERFASNPETILAEMGLEAGSSEAMQFISRIGSLEPTGPFALTNSLAGLMAGWLTFLAVMLSGRAAHSLVASSPRRASWPSLAVAVGLMIAFFATLLMTKSRSAWLATAFTLLAACILHPELRRGGFALVSRFRAVISMVVLICTVAVGGVLVRDPTMVVEAGKSLSYRFDYWRGAIELIRAKPWTGYGFGNFQQNYNRVKLPTASESPADPHNFILETALTGGTPLLVALLGILAILFWRMIELSRPAMEVGVPFGAVAVEKDQASFAVGVGGFLGLAGALSFGFFAADSDALNAIWVFAISSIAIFAISVRWEWLESDQQLSIASSIAAAVILTHLLASGGWMQPGLMNSLCIFVGIPFGLSAVRENSISKSAANRFRGFAVPTLVMVVLIFIGFARTMCFPVLASEALASAKSTEKPSIQDPVDWLEFIETDRFNPDLPRIAAAKCVDVLSGSELSKSTQQKYLEVFEACCLEYVSRDPNQWMTFAELGKWNAALAQSTAFQGKEKSSEETRKQSAFESFAKSAELHPSSAQAQLQAAVMAIWFEKLTEAKSFMNKASIIDQLTTHSDRKLGAAIVLFPRQLELIYAPLVDSARLVYNQRYSRGEPTMLWLRNNVP